MTIFVFGFPSFIGGADTELWHVLRLWRSRNLVVHLDPTWHSTAEWKRRCEDIGVIVHELTGSDKLGHLSGLPGSTVISFCNGEFLRHADVFRQLNCRIVWVGCMTWMFSAEREHYEKIGPFDGYVFQSDFQRSALLPELDAFGVPEEQCFTIRGAFDPSEFPFAPRAHESEADFVFGRLARPDLDKWSSNTWSIYGAVPYARCRARVMGWDDRVGEKLGRPPEWAEVLPACAESSHEFLTSLHCLISINGGAAENWPRIGLEAMSTGVPVIAENQWGWREMIVHGETGFLANSDEEFSYYAAYLAMNEDARQRIVKNARARLVEELANPEVIAAQWQKLLQYVKSRPPGHARGRNNGEQYESAPAEDSHLAVEQAWQAESEGDLATMSLREAFQKGFAAGRRIASATGKQCC